MDINFWGVRGSVPSPLTGAQVEAKIREAVKYSVYNTEEFRSENRANFIIESIMKSLPQTVKSTFGGNTTCVEVNCDDLLFILDMGTGVRELGNAQMKKIMQTKELHGAILQSHVHWDHIQGIPFWKPLYLPRKHFNTNFKFFGGKQWDSQLDLVYRGQMNAPMFPVNLQEIEKTGMHMTFSTIWDGWDCDFISKSKDVLLKKWQDNVPNENAPLENKAYVLARKLFHPQETFGYRIEYKDKSIAFTTDHEPYAAGVPKALLELVNGVDVWITDCQYSHDDYLGKIGPQKFGWGHSFPEYIAQVGKEAQPKQIITTHHDPEADDQKIIDIAKQVEYISGIQTTPAFEGLNIDLK